ncbi:MAG TPA: hypothetical protein VJ773_00985 [Gemmatimonadales bacterium]|nr:hypothetical protein [Gemmatimonadales bacterium]
MRYAPTALLALALAACDANSTAPLPPPDGPSGPAGMALQDALERIAPTLGHGSAAAALRSALMDAVEEPSLASLAAVEATLGGIETEQPDLAVEADVIRLAVAAQR